MADKPDKKRRIIANPDDPATGEYTFGYYRQTRPRVGEADDIARARKELRGLSGKTVRITVHGQRYNANDPNDVRPTKNVARAVIHRYGDVFGADGVLLQMFKRQVEANSDDVYIVNYIDIEEL
jgi:hypothetical protein